MSTIKLQSSDTESTESKCKMASKYTYADLSHFHRTVLAILNHNIPDTLDIAELKTVQQYICIVTSLIDTPDLFSQFASNGKYIPAGVSFVKGKLNGTVAIWKLKNCLKALITWMREVIQIPDLTLEILLDEYYSKFPYASKPPVSIGGFET